MNNNEKQPSKVSWYTKVLKEKEVVRDVTIESYKLGADKVDFHFLQKGEFKNSRILLQHSCSKPIIYKNQIIYNEQNVSANHWCL